MVTKDVNVRVRYKETDQMGVVHHSNYVNFYEVARTEMLRDRGLTYRRMEELGVMLPVREVSMKFIRPAHYDDLLTIRTTLHNPDGARLEFEHEIYNEQGELLNTGHIELIFVDAATRRPCHVPDWFKELFK